MKKIKYLILDDEPLAHDVIIKYSEEFPFLELSKQCFNALEAIKWLENDTVDLIFLDVQMPKLTGMAFLRMLKSPPVIVITSAYEDYALESFDMDVCDYLLKPFGLDRFYGAINRVKQALNLKEQEQLSTTQHEGLSDAIFIKGDKKHHRIKYDDILSIEGYGQYCKIHTLENTILTLERLSKLLERLPESLFIRTHKSHIVAISQIKTIEGNEIITASKRLPIGVSFRDTLKTRLGLS